MSRQCIRTLATASASASSSSVGPQAGGPTGPSPVAVVRTAIRLHGPITTRSLYATLHSTFVPLPPRPPPANFLTGLGRQERARTGVHFTPPSKTYPGQQENTAGTWSMAYLKRVLLKGMEGRGEVYKLSRRKWDRWGGVETLPVSEVEAGEEMATAAKGKKGVRKLEEEHVWVDKDAYAQRRQAFESQLTPWEPTLPRAPLSKADEELREAYGLGSN